MGSSTNVVLYCGFDTKSSWMQEIHDYVTSGTCYELGTQALTLISNDELYPHGYDKSGQAGSIRVYAGLLRKVSIDGVIEWLEDCPHIEGCVVIIKNDTWDEVIVHEFKS